MLLFLRKCYWDFSKRSRLLTDLECGQLAENTWKTPAFQMKRKCLNILFFFNHFLKQQTQTKEITTTVFVAQTRLRVVLLSTVQEFTEAKSMIREHRFQSQQHPSMLFGIFKNILSCGIQHLTSVMKNFSLKIESSSFFPTLCDKTACNILRTRMCTYTAVTLT